MKNTKNSRKRIRRRCLIHNSCFLIRERGFGLVEVVVAVTIVTLLIVGFGEVIQTSLRLVQEERARFEATLILDEGVEGMRALRDASWSRNIASLTTGIPHYLTATTTWGIWTASQSYIAGRYERTIQLDSVNRESGTDRIVETGGYVDAGTKKLTITVSWRLRSATTSVSSVTYLTNFLQN